MTNATFAVEHGGSGRIAWNFVAEKFLAQCKSNPNIVKRLRENPQLLDSVINVYIGAQIERLLSMRNAAGVGGPYAGPQLAVYQKMFGARFIVDMAKVLGPYALPDDDERGLDEGIFEVGERCGICLAPGGTPEAMKIIISRALAIGR